MDSTRQPTDEEIIYTWNNASSPSAAAARLSMELDSLHWIIQKFRRNGVEVKRFRRKKRNYARLQEVNNATQRQDQTHQ
jgi:hypothetical protein